MHNDRTQPPRVKGSERPAAPWSADHAVSSVLWDEAKAFRIELMEQVRAGIPAHKLDVNLSTQAKRIFAETAAREDNEHFKQQRVGSPASLFSAWLPAMVYMRENGCSDAETLAFLQKEKVAVDLDSFKVMLNRARSPKSKVAVQIGEAVINGIEGRFKNALRNLRTLLQRPTSE